MAKNVLKVTKETKTGKNIQFQDTRNNKIMSDKELISRLEKGTSAYNESYSIKKVKNGQKYVDSKPDGIEKNNLG